MSQINTYLHVPPYVKEWAEKHLGAPVRFPYNTVEDKMLRRFMDKWPDHDATSDDDTRKKEIKSDDDNLAIALPSTKAKDPRTYSYLGHEAKNSLAESLETLFLHNLWSDLCELQGCNCSLSSLIRAWLEQHGIDFEHEETIRQRFYRLRKKYAQREIVLHHNRTEHEVNSEQVGKMLKT